MNTLRNIQNLWRNDRGFTLAEVMITIVILGILAGIAIPSWWSIVESRRVDSATNQLVGDLRLAHSKASSRLTTYQTIAAANSTTYQIGPYGGLPGSFRTYTLPDGTKTKTGINIAFCADGSLEAPPSPGSGVCPSGRATPFTTDFVTIKVTSDDNPCMDIQVNKATSRVSSARATSCT